MGMEQFGDDVSQDIISFGHGQEFADKAIADKVLTSKPLPGNQTYQQESSTNIQKLDAGNEAHQKVIQTTKIQAAVNEKTEKKDSGQIQYESKFIEQSNIESKQAVDQQQKKEIIKDKEVKSSKSGQKIKPNIERKEENDVNVKDKSTKNLISDTKAINKDKEEIKSEVQLEKGLASYKHGQDIPKDQSITLSREDAASYEKETRATVTQADKKAPETSSNKIHKNLNKPNKDLV